MKDLKIHYIMPMAGRGSRFQEEGFALPKPLIEIYGKPFFYWAVQSINKFVKPISLDFVILQEHVDIFHIDRILNFYFPEADIHILPEVTKGAVITCMKGMEDIEDDLPVVFNDCDHMFKCSAFNSYCMNESRGAADGILLTFQSKESKYAYLEMDYNGDIIRTAEKEAVSNKAICGCYYFKNAKIFMESAKEYILKCSYSEYFMSGVYNVMIRNHQCICSMNTDFHVPFGAPEEYDVAKGSDRYKELL